MPEPFTISQSRLNDLKACLAVLDAQFTSLQEGIDFNVAAGLVPPDVPWFDEERRDVLRQATCLVFLTELDLACYPLSASAVLFFEP